MNKEEILLFGEENNLIGIYSSNPHHDYDTAVIMLNAGIIHRIGPNQLYANLAKHLASLNISTFRFDFSGIGDSSFGESDWKFQENYYKSALAAIDHLNVNRGISKFILIGLCSGADVSIETALHSDKISAICFINGEYFNVEGLPKLLYPIVYQRLIVRYNLKNIFNLKRWKRLATSKKKLFSFKTISFVIQFMLKSLKNKFGLKKTSVIQKDINVTAVDLSNSIFSFWKNLIDRNVNIYQIYSEGSIGLDLYKILLQKRIEAIKDNRVKIEIFRNIDHTFTPTWAQEYLFNSIYEWLCTINDQL